MVGASIEESGLTGGLSSSSPAENTLITSQCNSDLLSANASFTLVMVLESALLARIRFEDVRDCERSLKMASSRSSLLSERCGQPKKSYVTQSQQARTSWHRRACAYQKPTGEPDASVFGDIIPSTVCHYQRL